MVNILCPPKATIASDSPYAIVYCEECVEVGTAPEPVTPPEEEGYFGGDQSVEFTVFGGRQLVGTQFGGNCVYPNPGPPTTTVTSWEGEFWYSDDGGGTFSAVAGTANSFASPGDPTPWSYSVAIDPTLFNTAGRRFYLHYRVNGGGWVTTYYSFYVDYTQVFTNAAFWMNSADYTGVPNGWIYTFWKVWASADSAVLEDLYVALFDRETDTMIPGSELVFTQAELLSFKTAYISGSDFPFTHEVEIRAKSDAVAAINSPWLQEAYLYIDSSNITAFTSFQRVGRGSLAFGWGLGEPPYPAEGQTEYMWSPPNRWNGGVDCSARAMLNKVAGMEIRYQMCANIYDYGYPLYLDPTIDYEYEALWDNGTDDEGLPPAGYNRVNNSKLNFLLGDFTDYQARILRTTEDIEASMVDDHRYCQMNLDDEYWIFPMNAQMLTTVRGTGPLDLPDTFIYLFAGTSCAVWSTGLITPSNIGVPETSYKRWDPSKYDGVIQAWFEVTLHNGMQEVSAISLVDEIGTVLGTINIPVTEPPIGASTSYMDWYTYRVAVTLPVTASLLAVLFPTAHFNARLYVKEAFVRIRQTGATKSRTFIPLFSFGWEWGSGAVSSSNWVGASAEVMTNGVYLPNFDETNFPADYSIAIDGLPIIKLG